MHLTIAHLYPSTMSTYGDQGNVICLRQRAEWRGIMVSVEPVEIGAPLPKQVHWYFFGGGQDAAQAALAADLREKATRIREDVESGTPLLAICGGYQLLGESYSPFDAPIIQGAGLFPVRTEASHDRMIGNLIISANGELQLPKEQTIVGFENHSGKTYLLEDAAASPLGQVRQGNGNNGADNTEGCLYHNAIGCYLHGSLLPKNPHLADWLLERACRLIDPGFTLQPLDDTLEWQAHQAILDRYHVS